MRLKLITASDGTSAGDSSRSIIIPAAIATGTKNARINGNFFIQYVSYIWIQQGCKPGGLPEGPKSGSGLPKEIDLEVSYVEPVQVLTALALCGVLAMAACSSANKDWANASAQNTVAAYQSFLDKHAGDRTRRRRETALQRCKMIRTWQTAQNGNSLDSYQQYLQAEPNGTHAQAARDQITSMERANAWKTAQSDGSATALQAFLQKYPQGAEADQARQKLAALNSDYRAELGAFHDKRAAERKRSELQSRFSSVLKEVEVLSPDSSNPAISSDVRAHGSS